MTDAIAIGDAITGDADSPVVAYLDRYAASPGAVTVDIPAAGELATAVTNRLADDYPDVHLWAGDRTLAIADHASPVPEDGAGGYPVRLSALPGGVRRRKVVTPIPDAVRTCVLRQYVVDALDHIATETPISVTVEPGGLAVIKAADVTVGIAPKSHPGNAWPDTGADCDLSGEEPEVDA